MEKVKVRGLVDCGGLWGNLNIGEEKMLAPDIAESLVRAEYAEYVDVPPVENEKKEGVPPSKRSKRESAS